MKNKNLKRIFLSLFVLSVGFVGMKMMVNSKKEQIKQAHQIQGALVETMSMKKVDRPLEIHTNGTIQPRRMVELIPQVGGLIIQVDDRFLAGEVFKEGDVLFQIDPTDYELVLERARSKEVNAKYELAKMEGQARVARQEWKRLNGNAESEPNPLVLYGPQLDNAKAALSAAQAEVRQAEVNLNRTKVRAPFDCMVKSERIEEGQMVNPGQSVGSLRGTNHAEIIIPVTFSDLSWLDVPMRGGTGSPATIKLGFNGHSRIWEGAVERSLGEVDAQGRMIRLVVGIPDPYGLEKRDGQNELFLAEGMFVDVTLKGKPVENAFEIPSSALREGTFVWVMGPDQELQIKQIELIRNQGETVWVKGPLSTGDQLILTYVPGAVQGMKLRVKERS